MGLAERRAIKEFQDSIFPDWQKKITAAAGFDVPIEVDWNTLALEGETHLYNECWPKVFFQPLVEGLESITRDDMGKEAVKESLKKITIKANSDVIYGDTDKYAKFGDGTLALEHAAHSNVDNIAERTKGIVTAVEKAL